jgi:hypothetical protein
VKYYTDTQGAHQEVLMSSDVLESNGTVTHYTTAVTMRQQQTVYIYIIYIKYIYDIIHTHTHTHVYTYIYIYIYMCVCIYIHMYMYVYIYRFPWGPGSDGAVAPFPLMSCLISSLSAARPFRRRMGTHCAYPCYLHSDPHTHTL